MLLICLIRDVRAIVCRVPSVSLLFDLFVDLDLISSKILNRDVKLFEPLDVCNP